MITRINGDRNDCINLGRLNDESIIIEAGAAIGYTIECLRQHNQTRRCRVFAIECNRTDVKILREKKLNNVKIYSRALVGQDHGKNIKFYQHLGLPQWGNVFIKRTPSHKKFKGIKEYRVKTLKINDIFSVLGIDKIDYMRLDIEGSEKEVLETMSEETASKIDQLNVRDYFNSKVKDGYFEKIIEKLGFEIKIREKYQIFCERNS